jgi:hypothetical protein
MPGRRRASPVFAVIGFVAIAARRRATRST